MFRDHGLEYFRVVRGEFGDLGRVARRMHRVRARAPFLAPDRCRWTLEPPPDYPVPETLDVRLERAGLTDALTHT
jgi:hypothetical protein